MKIDWNQKPAEISMKDLRDFMKRNIPKTDEGASLDDIIQKETNRMMRQAIRIYRDKFPTRDECKAVCAKHVEQLQSHGYIETCKNNDSPEAWYRLAYLGLSFWESKARRFTRQAAQAQLDKFIDRCRELNACTANITQPESIVWVDAALLFGSFALDLDEVGDVDIAIRLSVRDILLYRQYLASIRSKPLEFIFSKTPENLALKKLRKGLNILRTYPKNI